MKRYLLILFVFSSCLAAHRSQRKGTAVAFERKGYINGLRLDSIRSEYAEVSFSSKFIYMDYGQPWSRSNDNRITNEAGDLLRFRAVTLSTMLNFMGYNGWEYMNDARLADSLHTFIFRKKKR